MQQEYVGVAGRGFLEGTARVLPGRRAYFIVDMQTVHKRTALCLPRACNGKQHGRNNSKQP